jgi:hypothetical protein
MWFVEDPTAGPLFVEDKRAIQAAFETVGVVFGDHGCVCFPDHPGE